MTIAWLILGIALTALTLPGTIELLTLTLGALLPARRRPPPLAGPRAITFVVPAHDEQADIARTVTSLTACTVPTGVQRSVVVVADNCTDDTARVAARAGAEVLERRDAGRRGKGWALEYAFERLSADAFVVVDADTVVEANLLASVADALAGGADAVQAGYGVLNEDAGLRTRLMSVALKAFNVLRPRGRHRLGLSAGILGNGFALTRETLSAVPYDARSVVEDLEYHLRLVSSGRRVHFLDDVRVWAEMPTGGGGVVTQRARWEGGRLQMIGRFVPTLARQVIGGRWRLLEPLFELLLLPLAFHVLLLLAALAVPCQPTRWLALAGLLVTVLHVLVAIAVGGGGWRDLTALAAAPFYVIWKLSVARAIARATQNDATWVRTERTAEKEESR